MERVADELAHEAAGSRRRGVLVGREHAELTERELEVVRHVARGRTNADIAARLFLSEATVKTHLTRILAKLGVRDRVQVVVLAYESGLVQPGAAEDGGAAP